MGDLMDYEKPTYSFNFDDETAPVISGEAPNLHELTKKVMQSMNTAPVMSEFPESYVELPAGLIHKGEVLQTAEVQELTGEHEEKLAKAKTSNNPAKYVNTLIQCGTVSIGDVKATAEILDSLLQGDLDTLILGIRRATFGDEFELNNVECPNCGESNDLTLNLKDIPLHKLADPAEREFLVDLRKGRKAKVQFPTGAVQAELFKKQMTIPEMNSLTLSHCVISFIDPSGNETLSNGLSDVKKLGLADRTTLQTYIYENQPGPKYDKVTAQCHSCEHEIQVPLSVGLLFREL